MRQRKGLVVLRHRRREQLRPVSDGESVEPGNRECGDDLSHPVGSVVEAEDRVAVADARHRIAVARHDQRLDELVGLAALVCGTDAGDGVRNGRTDAVHHGVVCQSDAVPALVTIHREVAAGERRDPGAAAADAIDVR